MQLHQQPKKGSESVAGDGVHRRVAPVRVDHAAQPKQSVLRNQCRDTHAGGVQRRRRRLVRSPLRRIPFEKGKNTYMHGQASEVGKRDRSVKQARRHCMSRHISQSEHQRTTSNELTHTRAHGRRPTCVDQSAAGQSVAVQPITHMKAVFRLRGRESCAFRSESLTLL